jgi:hypothetical protein
MLNINVFVFKNNLKHSYKQFICIIGLIKAKTVKFQKMQL